MSKTTTSPMLWIPSAADGIQLTPSASAWTNAAYTELTSSAPTDMYLAYIAVLPNNGSTVAEMSAEIDIAIGASGSEVVMITHRFRIMADQWGPMSTVPLGLIYNKIAAGTRVAMRVRHGATGNTNVYRVALGYFTTLGGATGASAFSPSVTPNGASPASLAAGTPAWTFGSWVDVIPAASVTVPLLITGVVFSQTTAVHEIQIGLGAAGSEVSKMTLPYGTTVGGGSGFNYARLHRPLFVPVNTRVAARARCGTALATLSGIVWHVRAF